MLLDRLIGRYAARVPRRVRWTRQRIVYALDLWHGRHLRPPSAREWWLAGDDHPSSWTVIKTFGSWNAAIAAAGFRVRARGQARKRPQRPRCPVTGQFVSAHQPRCAACRTSVGTAAAAASPCAERSAARGTAGARAEGHAGSVAGGPAVTQRAGR
jgi:hypothetical protein